MAPSAPSGATRERILDAAERVLRTLGLARATTKEIARAAGCSEAALYKHFRGKEELFVRVLEERLPPLAHLLTELSATAGEGTVAGHLEDVVRKAVQFYRSSLPIGGSLFAEPALLARHRAGLRSMDAGPHRPVSGLAEYLRTEQRLGRVRKDADPEAGAALLMGACFQRAFLCVFMGEEAGDEADGRFAEDIVRTLLHGLA